MEISGHTGYEEALKAVIAIRQDRFKQYGDTWQDDTVADTFFMLRHKINRAEFILKNPTKQQYETLKDTMIDSVNYALFVLQKLILKEKQNENRHI